MQSQKIKTTFVVLLWFILFSAGFWAIDQGQIVHFFKGFAQESFLAVKLRTYVVYSLILSFVYFLVFYIKKMNFTRNLSGHWVALIVFFVAIFTPTVLQTDQVRYIWDGIVSVSGFNPYIDPPKKYPFFYGYLGHQILNHVELRTIYPPFAQIIFHISCYLNPFMWNMYLGWEWMPHYNIENYFQMEFGWKVICGLMAAITVWVFRFKRWDLLVFHPLFLMTWLGNGHVDTLLCGFLALAIYGTYRGFLKYHFFFAAVFSKWLPIIYLPGFLLKLKRTEYTDGKGRLKFALVLGSTAIWIALFYLYWSGSGGNMFNSSKTYAAKWLFFGYFHHTFRDLFILMGHGVHHAVGFIHDFVPWVGNLKIAQYFMYYPYENGIRIFTKWFSLGLSGMGMLYCLNLYRIKVISFRLLVYLTTFFLLAFFPTVHPWYLLILLVAWLPYHKVFITPVVWGSLILTSKLFYIDNQELVWLRYGVYIIVTFFLVLDLKQLKSKFTKGLRKSAYPIRLN